MGIARWKRLALGGLLAGAATAATAQVASERPLDEHGIAQTTFGADADWYEGNIPFFESSDQRLNQIYYYRWKVFRSHQRDLGALGYITTEFLDDVSWQRQPYASLNDASAFHIEEGRWLRDRRFVDDYITYLLDHGGNDHHFSESIAGAVYDRFLADGDLGAAVEHLAAMKVSYRRWDDHWDGAKQLYWIEPIYDATEYTISSIDASGGADGFFGGAAFRPSINSYMFANAHAISRLAALSGDVTTAAEYERRASSLRRHIEQDLWNPTLDHFIDRYQVSNQFVKYWEPIRGRELVGYLPWTYGAVDDARYAGAWSHILSADQLGGPRGLRTVEPSFPYFMRQYRYDDATHLRECQWNGPVWPFQTTQVLQGMARVLRGPAQNVVSRADYVRLLRQYADLHMFGDHPDIQEDYDPASGAPIVGLPRSHHYMHSAFDDLIISGLVGLVPREDDVVEVDPLLPLKGSVKDAISWFALQDVPYHGHLLTIIWDSSGQHFHGPAGLRILVDGKGVASRTDMGRIVVKLPRRDPPSVQQRTDLAASLSSGDFPRGSASVNDEAEIIHQAMDGRVWFFPDVPNGWSTVNSSHAQDWFQIDFGQATRVGSAELAFYADGRAFVAPEAYKIQWWDGAWHDMPGVSRPVAKANGVTPVSWQPVTSSRLRIMIDKPAKGAIRLVEFKVF